MAFRRIKFEEGGRGRDGNTPTCLKTTSGSIEQRCVCMCVCLLYLYKNAKDCMNKSGGRDKDLSTANRVIDLCVLWIW